MTDERAGDTHWPTDDFYAESYECVFPPNRAESELLLKHAETIGDPVLDAGCGSGRLLIDLAGGGFNVVGIESSPGQWRILQSRLKRLPSEMAARISVMRQDMFNMCVDRQFRICFSNSWYLTERLSEVTGIIQKMASLLTGEGCIILSDFSWMQTIRDQWLGKPMIKQARAQSGSVYTHTKIYTYDEALSILRADVRVEQHLSKGDEIRSQSYSWLAKYVDDISFRELIDHAGCFIDEVHEGPNIQEKWFELRLTGRK